MRNPHDPNVPAPSTDTAPGSPDVLTPIPSLVRSKDIVKLWMMRILVRLEAGRKILVEQCCRQGERAAALRRLGILHMDKNADDKAANDRLLKRLAITLTAMEQRADKYIWNTTVGAAVRSIQP